VCVIKESTKEYRREWWKRNKDKVAQYRKNRKAKHAAEMKQYQRDYYAEHKEWIQERSKRWWDNNPNKAAEYCKVWRQNHPDRSLLDTEKSVERMRKRREDDPEGTRKYQNDWAHENSDKIVKYAFERRSKIANAGSFTAEEWENLLEQCGNKCVCCGKKKKLTVDHIVPVIKGGTNLISNIQPLCKSCNSSKHTKTIRYVKEGATTIHEIPLVGNEIV
jgi:5-methylcytosine-specific restriction endonuclease McrA